MGLEDFVLEQLHIREADCRAYMLRLMNTGQAGVWTGDGSRAAKRPSKGNMKAAKSVNAFMERQCTEIFNAGILNKEIPVDDEARQKAMMVIEEMLGTHSYMYRQELASQVVRDDRDFILASEHVDVYSGNYPVESPRHTHLKRSDQVNHLDVLGHHIGDVHGVACSAVSNTWSSLCLTQWDIIKFRLRLLDIDERESMCSGSIRRAMRKYARLAAEAPVYIKTPFTNLDYRMRKYARMILAITGGKALRSMHCSEPYDFTDEVKVIFETMLLPKAFPDIEADALLEAAAAYGRLPWKKLAETDLTFANIRLVRAYALGLDTDKTNYWLELDAVASGIVNALLQLGIPLGVIIGDLDDPAHVHARRVFAEHLVETVDAFASCDPADPDFDVFLKLVLSPLMYGAMMQGVHKALIGERWDEDAEVDEDLYAEASEFLMALPMFKGKAVQEVHDLLGGKDGLCADIGIAYSGCFPELAAAMEQVASKVQTILEAGDIPEFTTVSGGRCLLSMIKRRGGTRPVHFDYEASSGLTVSTQAWTSSKVTAIKALVAAAFSWVLHNTDAEIISHFSALADDASIPHFTNHDAIMVRVCDMFKAIRLYTSSANSVNSQQVLVNAFGCPAAEYIPLPDDARSLDI
jgi:hypothetical protein